MPLVVPGLATPASNNTQQEDWLNKLVGKKITNGASDELVSLPTSWCELRGLY